MKKMFLLIALVFQCYVFLAQSTLPKEHLDAFYQKSCNSVILKRDLVVVRYTARVFDAQGKLIRLSNWYAPAHPILSHDKVRELLQLPPGSSGDFFEHVVIPQGTRLHYGKVARGEWTSDGAGDLRFVPNNGTTGMMQYYIATEDIPSIRRMNQIHFNAQQKPSFTPVYKVKENTSPHHIQKIIQNYGAFPGGIVVQPSGSMHLRPKHIQYLPQEGTFLINGRFRFNPMLTEEEIAHLVGLAFLSRDQRLAALAQDQFTNVSANSTLASALADADNVLGWVAYGYNMFGKALPDSLSAPGYVNPLLSEQRQLSTWWNNWEAVKRIAYRNLKGIEPRVFLEFNKVQFVSNYLDNTIEAAALDMQVNYQAFEYDINGREVFNQRDPSKFYPFISKAVQNFKTHFDWYEKRFPQLSKARKIAETYALLKYMNTQHADLDGFDPLFEQYLSPFEWPMTYDNYNNIDPNGDLVKGYKLGLNRVSWIPTWMLKEEDQILIKHLKLHLAAQTMEAKKIAKHRKLMASCLDQVKIKSIDLEPSIKKIKQNLWSIVAIGIPSKQIFADHYNVAWPDLCKKYYEECIAYYQAAIKLEPENYVNFAKLTELYKKLDYHQKAAEYRKKTLPLLISASKKGDLSATVLIGDLYQEGLKMGKKPNYSRAFEYHLIAANQGYSKAYIKVANAYLSGKGVYKDFYKARIWYEKVADEGINEGHYMLGRFYESGQGGLTLNFRQAKMHYSIAAEAGNKQAQVALGMLLYSVESVRDLKKSYFWFQQAALQGDDGATKAVRFFEEHKLI